MNWLNQLSLRTKINGLIGLVVILIGCGSIFSLTQMATSYEVTVQKSFDSYAGQLGQSLAVQFFERYGDVQAFAENNSVQNLNPSEINEDIDRWVELYGIYDLIVVVDKKGKLVATNNKDALGKSINKQNLESFDFANSPWFKSALNGQFTEDKAKGFSGTFFEDVMIDPLLQLAVGEKRMGTSFSTQIKNKKGEVIGVISTRAGSRWFENEIKSFYQNMVDLDLNKIEITLLNRDGLVLVDHDPATKTNGKNEIFQDFENTILTFNLFNTDNEFAKELKQKKSGYGIATHARKKIEQLGTYQLIESPKWISDIGWSVLIRDDVDEALASVNSAKMNFYLLFGMVVFIALALSFWFSMVISKLVNQVTTELAKNSEDVSAASEKIASSATELSESATEQAAALQETVAAVDEIGAMVEKNAESAHRSKEMSASSRKTAERGQHTVQNMLKAIDDIGQSNNEISTQMEASNRQLSDITRLINDIGTKTKVINEIVFQTKLLSFNASVEAARAGEYGKGFAVVAEEVGNLAQMSGNAAKEITTLLEESVRKVESIVSETKGRVEKLMTNSRDKVAVGSETARECHEVLNEILQNVQNVDSLVTEIAVASSEQSTGIKEIQKAVNQLEQVTHQNTSVAQMSSVSAEQLRSQSVGLNVIVTDLMHIVQGNQGQDHTTQSSSASVAGTSTGSGSAGASRSTYAHSNSINKQNLSQKPTREEFSQDSGRFDDFAPTPTARKAGSNSKNDRHLHVVSEAVNNNQAHSSFGHAQKHSSPSIPPRTASGTAVGSDFVPSSDDPGFDHE